VGRQADRGLLVVVKGGSGPMGLLREFEEGCLPLGGVLELKQPSGGLL
jgi:hypothetical protein